LNWIFPIAGFGTRTSELGLYKPLIEVLPNQSVIKICISGLKTMFKPKDKLIFICSEQQNKQHSVKAHIQSILRDIKVNNEWVLIELDQTPAGQALTIKNGISKLNLLNYEGGTFVVNSDQMVFFDYASIDFDKCSVGLYFNDKPSSCFYKLDLENRNILEIKEKKQISCYAAAGVFYFNSLQKMLECIEWGIKNNKKYNGELYLGPCMECIKDLKYFQNMIKFDLGNPQKIKLFRDFLGGIIN